MLIAFDTLDFKFLLMYSNTLGVAKPKHCLMAAMDSKVDLQTDESEDNMKTVIQFDGILHRFHRAELNPISFGIFR
jgi:hypothetical protein